MGITREQLLKQIKKCFDRKNINIKIVELKIKLDSGESVKFTYEIEKKMKCLICGKDNPKERVRTCSKKCSRAYCYGMGSKQRRKLRESKNDS